MFDNIIEFIQNSVTTVVGFTVGILGIGAGDFNPQDTSLTTGDVEISESLSEDSGIFNLFDSQTANISEALQPVPSEGVVEGDGDGDGDGLPAGQAGGAVAVVSTDEVAEGISILSQETELTRSINPIKSTKKTKEVDASLILKTDFDKFDFNLQITKITEDDNGFYSTYQFHSFAIENKVWEEVIKEKQISVTKATLGEQDLGDYLSEELGEVVDNEIVFLKEVQEIQKAKQDALAQEITEQEKKTADETDYSALIGRVLDIDNEQFGDYEPILTDDEEDEEIAPFEEADEIVEVQDNTTTDGVVDNEAPIIIIQGNNPALIQIGSSYVDLGAKVTDNISDNLGVKVGGDVVDTSIEDSYFITYTAVDEAGNVATATREVIVYDYGAVPEVEQIEPPVVEEEIVEEVEEPIVIEEVVAEEVEEEIAEPIVIEEEVVATTTEEVVVEDTTSVAEVVADVAGVVVESVVDGSKKVGKKVKETVDVVGNTTEVVAEAINDTTEAVIETITDTTEAVVETVVETTTETIEQISEGIEVVAEEISAMIKAVHFMELISNIRSALQASIVNIGSVLQGSIINVSSALQASVSTAGDGAANVAGGVADVAGTVGQFFETIVNDVIGGVNWVFDSSHSVLQGSISTAGDGLANVAGGVVDVAGTVGQFFKTMVDGAGGVSDLIFDSSYSILSASVSKASDGLSDTVENVGQFFKTTANDVVRGVDWTVDKSQNLLKEYWKTIGLEKTISKVSNRVTASVNNYRNDLDEKDESKYQKESFVGFIFKKIIETPKIILNKIINTTTGLTATVKNYSQVVSSDLGVAGEQIDKKIDEISFSPKGIIQGVKDTFSEVVSNVFNFFKIHRPL